jgi:hypothetical protein
LADVPMTDNEKAFERRHGATVYAGEARAVRKSR